MSTLDISRDTFDPILFASDACTHKDHKARSFAGILLIANALQSSIEPNIYYVSIFLKKINRASPLRGRDASMD